VTIDLGRALAVAVEAARAGEEPIMRRFRTGALGLQHKGDGSPVTEADREAELAIRAVLRDAFPEIGVFGEEHGEELGADRSHRWIVDPIDGTISFVHGIPLFGTIVGLQEVESGRSVVGVLNFPALGETYSGAAGRGCLCGEQQLRIPPPPADLEAERVVVSAGDPRQFIDAGCADDHARLARSDLFRGYSDCFGHAMVLRGGVGVMVDPGLAPWDVVASTVLAEEAGGAAWTRPSLAEGKVDLILGRADLVDRVGRSLGWIDGA